VGGDEDNSGDSNGGGHRQQSTKRAREKIRRRQQQWWRLNSDGNVNGNGDRDDTARWRGQRHIKASNEDNKPWMCLAARDYNVALAFSVGCGDSENKIGLKSD
jgi:hypothetical protein